MAPFHPAVRDWFLEVFDAPTAAQAGAWKHIAKGHSTLLLAPTGSGKTLAAFLAVIDRLMFHEAASAGERSTPGSESSVRGAGENGRDGTRVLYVSPLKALAVDVERNLRSPLIGISQRAAARGDAHAVPRIAVRSGDTPSRDRARFLRDPAEILITTPESLYLLLTSNGREALRSVETVIIDEIHALVPTKRGAHLALSLERLEQLVRRPLQRIGLSATQRPLDEVARYLRGGGQGGEVKIVDAGSKRSLELRIEVPVEDMGRIGTPIEIPSGPASQGPVRSSIWTAIHPRLLELVRAHTSTLIFVNSRRIAERLAGALNELAGETLVMAHHGSLAREQRLTIEDELKLGRVKGLVATSSLELGIDMGAIDLVVQIEAPPTVASGLQRIGRAGHQVDAQSRGVLFPKYRGDLVACAALSQAMTNGEVEPIRYPRNPLDVLAQHLVAMAAMDEWNTDALYDAVRAAAPFTELPRSLFESVLDMLSGRYVSDAFAELKPRLTWDRVGGRLTAREGARRVAVVNGGTIPDRGLYGVFLAGAPAGKGRVGELDEEMVFESRAGETFVLGASTWRIEEITHDRVLVSPAPGQPGKMPFWHGENAGRSVDFGRRIGQLLRELRESPETSARDRLVSSFGLDERAAENLLRYLGEQVETAGTLPDDRTVVVERTRDELGDWRICVLSPLGGQVLAPWAMAATARARDRFGVEAESMWTNDGFVVRIPESDAPPDTEFLFPEPEEIERIVTEQLGGSALFAARFREAAARALLLPRRRPGGRTPLWQQRRRASDLLAAASRYASFPIVLEAYRECLRDVFDLPSLASLLRDVRQRTTRVVTVDSQTPSPFASAILFSYVANYIYEGDAPLAERRAQVLAIDQAQLRELIGDLELREVLDADALHELELRLQHLGPDDRLKGPDAVHDLLLRLGDLSPEELAARAGTGTDPSPWVEQLLRARRILLIRFAGRQRLVAAEDAARYRDAFGVALPPGLPGSFLEVTPDARAQLIARYARTHAPFTSAEVAHRFAIDEGEAESILRALHAAGRLLEGAFRPGGAQREWSDPEVLRQLRRRSLAKLRREVEPVEPEVLGRFATAWHGLLRRRRGLDALLDVIEKLQGFPLNASTFERDVLAARIDGYQPADLDSLAGAGEVVWVGRESVGDRDGRISLYLTDALPRLRPPEAKPELSALEQKICAHLEAQGASFFQELESVLGAFPSDLVDALWGLVWKGLVTNDTFHALRSYTAPRSLKRGRRERPVRAFRTRRVLPPAAGGRWSLVSNRARSEVSETEWGTAMAWQLLNRYGVVTREVAQAEGLPGGFTTLHDVFVGLEEAGRIRRGYFVGGVGAMQFALPEALDHLRALRTAPELPEVVHVAASDPANPWGALLKWPALEGVEGTRGPTRTAGARVILVDGGLRAHLAKLGRQLLVWLPEEEPERSRVGRAVAERVAALGSLGEPKLIFEINGRPAEEHPLAAYLMRAGYTGSSQGLFLSRPATLVAATASLGGGLLADDSASDSATDEAEEEDEDDEAEETQSYRPKDAEG